MFVYRRRGQYADRIVLELASTSGPETSH